MRTRRAAARPLVAAAALVVAASAAPALAQDTTPPAIANAEGALPQRVDVTFSEAVDPATAETVANYALTGGVAIAGAALQLDGRTVALGTTALPLFTPLTVTVSDVEDLAGNPIAPGSARGFTWQGVVEVAFQDGALPDPSYAGTRDTYLYEDQPLATFGSATPLLADGDEPAGTDRDAAALVAWELSAIPADSTVLEARVAVNVEERSNLPFPIYPLRRAWTEQNASWTRTDGTVPWETPGAQGPTDRGDVALESILTPVTGLFEVKLNATGRAFVQGWIDGTIANHGIVVADPEPFDGLDLSSREHPVATLRPRLTVLYAVPGAVPLCGDGIVQYGEGCDDGNTVSGDGCDATCKVESPCGAVPAGRPGTGALALWIGALAAVGAFGFARRRSRRTPLRE